MTPTVDMTERQFQAQVIDIARRCAWKVWHFHDSRRQVRKRGRMTFVGDTDAKGFPDLVLVHPGTGQLMFRELKAQKGRATPDQMEAIAILAAAGLDAEFWRPSDMADIIATLQRRKPT